MKNLLSIVTIILLSIFISCSNNEKTDAISKNILIHDSIIKAAEDSILFEKRRIEDSIKLEVRNSFLRDSLEQIEIESLRLITQKGLDSIYPIWRTKKLDSVEILNRKYEYKYNKVRSRITRRVRLVDWLVKIGNNRPKQFKTSKDDFTQLKELILKMDKTPPNEVFKNKLVHPILGYYYINTPGVHDMVSRTYKDKTDFHNNSLWVFSNNENFDFNYKEFNNAFSQSKAKIVPIDEIWYFGGSGPNYILPEDIIGYRLVTENSGIDIPFNKFKKDNKFQSPSGILNYLSSKKIIDTSSYDEYRNKYSEEYWASYKTMNVLSKTDPLKLALLIIQIDIGNPDISLLDCKGGVKLTLNKRYTLKYSGGELSFLKINGKIFYEGYDNTDSRYYDFFDFFPYQISECGPFSLINKNSDCFLFKKLSNIDKKLANTSLELLKSFKNNDLTQLKKLIEVDEFNFFDWKINKKQLNDSFNFSQLDSNSKSHHFKPKWVPFKWMYKNSSDFFINIEWKLNENFTVINPDFKQFPYLKDILKELIDEDYNENCKVVVFVPKIQPEKHNEYNPLVSFFVFHPTNDTYSFKGIYSSFLDFNP
tara:strand:+ start:69 stop:1844 length:1776 start_codon:yes stop_codon:yes gene_type:complete